MGLGTSLRIGMIPVCFVEVDGKKYRLGTNGMRTLEVLEKIVEARPRATYDPGWLMRFREQVRDIEWDGQRAALTYVVLVTRDPAVRRLAIWLRGRCGGTLGTRVISRFAFAPDMLLRKDATRALKRMHAWSTLREVAQFDSVPRIRRMARQSPPKPYTSRLSSFLGNVTPRKQSCGDVRLKIAESVDFSSGRPPKSSWWIRIMLERIRSLVRGAAT